MSRSKFWQKTLPCLAGILALFLLGYTYINSHETVLFDNEPTSVLQADWILHPADGSVPRPITLPLHVDAKAEQPLTVSCTLPDSLSTPVVLCFRSSQQRVRVSYNDSPIYSFGQDTTLLPFGKSPGSVWNLVRLPEGSEGQEIRIELTSPYDSYSGRIGEVFVGSKASLLFMLMHEYLLSFMLTLAVLICGIILLLFHFIFLQKNPAPPSILHLGHFALLVAGWMFGESKLVQFFISKPLFSLALTLFCMLFLPIPMIRYIRCIENFRNKRLCTHIITLLYLQFILVALLQLFNVIDLLEILPIVHIVFLSIALLILVLLLLSGRNARVQRVSAAVIVLLLFGMLETVAYYIPSHLMQTGVFFQFGVLLFIILQARVARNHALYIFRLSREATTDGLTDCQNRLAYSKRLQQQSLYSGLAAVVADMNGLKEINDTYGHAAGDEAILIFARCFKHVFSNFGDCYRIGGDEFVFISRIISDVRLRELILKLETLCKKQSAQQPYKLEVAVGYAIYDSEQDHRVSDLIRRADQAMYAQKKQMKQGF